LCGTSLSPKKKRGGGWKEDINTFRGDEKMGVGCNSLRDEKGFTRDVILIEEKFGVLKIVLYRQVCNRGMCGGTTNDYLNPFSGCS